MVTDDNLLYDGEFVSNLANEISFTKDLTIYHLEFERFACNNIVTE